jgi:fumarylpyruvate hydrolase
VADQHAVPAASRPTVAVAGSALVFPVRRIFCVGRNYAEHAREMGASELRAPPFFFTKPADAVVASGAVVPYPRRTADLHHEIELVVALGAGSEIFGYAVGNDLTRRDLQSEARSQGQPWDTCKGFDLSAPLAAISPVAGGKHIARGKIWLKVNGEIRQQADVSELIWSVPEIIAELSTFFELAPGDLIFTGTPAGVGPLKSGDRIEGGIDGLETLVTRIA